MRVLAVDDHPPILAAMQMILKELEQSAEIESAHDLEAAFAAASRARFDLVMLDLALPGCSGLEALARFLERFPDQTVVVVSGSGDAGLITEAINLGAMGFIPKSTSMERFLAALRFVLSGGTYVPPEALHAAAGARSSADDLGLSPRQQQVLALLMEGLSNKVIARKLEIAENTVKIHVGAVLAGLGVDTRAKAIVKGNRLGLGAQRAQ
jgi:DNA-binding NarL/FixJ family response regulator